VTAKAQQTGLAKKEQQQLLTEASFDDVIVDDFDSGGEISFNYFECFGRRID